MEKDTKEDNDISKEYVLSGVMCYRTRDKAEIMYYNGTNTAQRIMPFDHDTISPLTFSWDVGRDKKENTNPQDANNQGND